jgi:hypothetical protein
MKPLKPHSQCDRVLAHLSRGKPLTPLQALSRYGVHALSQRITELRKRGHRIETEPVTIRGRFGKAVIARYRLEAQ